MENFRDALEKLLNSCSMDNESKTPDFILADYLQRCLDNFDIAAVKEREKWYHREIKLNPPIAP